MLCRNCGVELPGDAAFCMRCGNTTAVVPAAYAAPRTSGMAIGSLIASIAGLVMCLFVGQIVGIILGILAKKEIREGQGRVAGDGLATAGIIVGIVGIVIDIVILFAWGAILLTF